MVKRLCKTAGNHGTAERCRSGIITILTIFFLIGCNAPFPEETYTGMSFWVFDAGQGLSQMVVGDGNAILFDVGPPESKQKWLNTYRKAGRPHLEAVVISHRDRDHSGGLQFIDSTVDWSGVCVISRWEDTVFLREQFSNWRRPVRFQGIGAGDSLEFGDGNIVRCLWPPSEVSGSVPVEDSETNMLSIVCRIDGKCTGILLTGDVDSTVLRKLTGSHGTGLRADILMIPHHGSASSVYLPFLNAVNPQYAVLSYGEGNSYGHPAAEMTSALAQSGISYVSTAKQGTLCWKSNGYYWVSLF